MCSKYYESTFSGRIHKIRKGGGHARPDKVVFEQDSTLLFPSFAELTVGYFKKKLAFKVPYDQVNVGDSVFKPKHTLFIQVFTQDHQTLRVNPTQYQPVLNCDMFEGFKSVE